MGGRLPGGASDDLGGNIPGEYGPNIPGYENPFGDSSGGLGDLPGGFGPEIPGGFGYSGLPGSQGPFGTTPGEDVPGGSMSGPFPGAEFSGGPSTSVDGGRTGDLFWQYNFNPEQQDRYIWAREMTEFDSTKDTSLGYDPNWQEPTVDPRDSMDPFRGDYEEWREPTKSDYDETDQDRQNFAEEQRKYEVEKQKQEEARIQRETDDGGSGGGSGGEDQSTPEDESSRSPFASPERLNWTRLGGLLVVDPPRDDMGGGSPGGSGGFDPTAIGQEALTPEEGSGTAARDPNAPLRVDPSVITDPPEPEGTGKEVADKNA
jgi:hypothetical protein